MTSSVRNTGASGKTNKPEVGVELLPTQKQLLSVLHSGKYHTCVWCAPVRQGKGWGTGNGFADLTLRMAIKYRNPGFRYILGGESQRSFIRNNLVYLRRAYERMGLRVLHDDEGYYVPGLCRLDIFGLGSRNSENSMRGATTHSAWLDEATLLDEDAVEEVYHRCSYGDSVVIMTTNADTPHHWLKKRIDSGNPGLVYLKSDFDENIFYDEDRRNLIRSRNPNTGNYRRKILNEWVSDEGLIYVIPKEKEISDDNLGNRGIVVMDPGIAGTTAALLFVRTGNTYVVADEYYHDANYQARITDADHLTKMRQRWRIDRLLIDPAAAHTRAVAHGMGLLVEYAPNDFENGVAIVNNVIYDGQVKVHQKCVNLLRECSALTWDEFGKSPLPGADHAADCLRYGCAYLFPDQVSQFLA